MARLRVFTGEAYSPALFELSDRERVVVGRASACDVVLHSDRVARRHFALERDGAGWQVSDWGSTNGTAVNGARVQTRRLADGDVISVLEVGLVFEEGDEVRNPGLEAAIAARPGSPEPVKVWADWLLERSDPLGEHLARALGGAEEHDPRWLGGLRGELAGWHCGAGWRNGLIESVQLRASHYPARPRALLGQLFRLRAARFLRHLEVDLAGLAASAEVDYQAELEAMAPQLPLTLESLSFGYHLGRADVTAPAAVAARLPRLAGAVVMHRMRAELVRPNGVRQPLTRLVSLGSDGELRLSEPVEPPQWAGRTEARLEPHNGRWELRSGYMLHPPYDRRGLVRVNEMPGYTGVLLDGDEIHVGDDVLRFELTPA